MCIYFVRYLHSPSFSAHAAATFITTHPTTPTAAANLSLPPPNYRNL